MFFFEGRIVRLDPDSDLAKSRKKCSVKFKRNVFLEFLSNTYKLSRILVKCVLYLPVLTHLVQAMPLTFFTVLDGPTLTK